MNRSIFFILGTYITIYILLLTGFFLLGIEQSSLNIGTLIFFTNSFSLSFFTTLFVLIRNSVTEKVFSISATTVLNIFYIITTIVSLFISGIFNFSLGPFILVQLVIIAIYLILFFAIVIFSGYIKSSDEKSYEKLQNGEYDKAKRGGF